jgi:hypothetical protein
VESNPPRERYDEGSSGYLPFAGVLLRGRRGQQLMCRS